MSTFSRILVASDFGPESDAALRWAACLCRGVGASIHLLHVVRDPVLAVATPEVYGLDAVSLREDALADAERRLAAQAASLGSLQVTREAIVGRAAETIVKRAVELPADVIVTGTHGRAGVVHMLFGSVADRVIRLAPCPVVTVRGNGAVRVSNGAGTAADRAAAPVRA